MVSEDRSGSRIVRGIRRSLLDYEVKHVQGRNDGLDNEPEGTAPSEGLTVLCLVRDGLPYVEPFLEHYRKLGVRNFVFLDNGSTDGTVEALCQHDEETVTVLSTKMPYGEYKYLMKRYLHRRFGMNRWSLYVDIDEFFDYPYSDTVGFVDLLAYLRGRDFNAVTCHMLDMFPERLAAEGDRIREEPDTEDFVGLHRFYDLSHLRRARPNIVREWGCTPSNMMVERFAGGIREALFDVRPNLTKYPLVFGDGNLAPSAESSHRVQNARIADISCVLYHYKFLARFHEHARRAVREGNYYAGSLEYRKYLEVLKDDPEMSLKLSTSRELSRTEDLLEENFLIVSETYVALADELDGSGKVSRAGILTGQRTFATALEQRRADDEKRRRDIEEGREILARNTRSLTPANDRLSERVRPLFIGGCQRSGTTAFVEYMNVHEEVALCFERYKHTPFEEITPELFTFERILAYRSGETNKPWNLGEYVRRHEEMLASKDPSRLAWIGDKNPMFVNNMDILMENNPGARFIMLYRPVEEVAESWEARSSDSEDFWGEDDGFEKGVRFWNAAMQSMADFSKKGGEGRLLILAYDDFFTQPGASVPALSRFLDMDFPEDVVGSWKEMSRSFRENRRSKSDLTEEQRAFIEDHADRKSEAIVLDCLQNRKDGDLTPDLRDSQRKLAEAEERAFKAERLYRQALEAREVYREQSGTLERQLEAMRASRSWRLILTAGKLKVRGNAILGSVFGRR